MGFTCLIYLACYKFMDSMVSGGMDLAMPGGMAEHAKDLLLVTTIVQFLSLLSNYFLILWLVVSDSAFGFYCVIESCCFGKTLINSKYKEFRNILFKKPNQHFNFQIFMMIRSRFN